MLGTVLYQSNKFNYINREDNTQNYEDTYSLLYKQIASFDDNDAILVGGDFNARTGTLKDFIENENNENNYLPVPECFINETFSRSRVNQDKKVNKFGYELRDICIGANLRILNGRTLGDLTGKYTYREKSLQHCKFWHLKISYLKEKILLHLKQRN